MSLKIKKENITAPCFESADPICGTCRYHRTKGNGEWTCVNADSEYCSDYTEYGDTCDEWEGR